MTPLEKLQNAEKDYHEALNEVFADEAVSLEAKSKLGGYLNGLLARAKEIRLLVGKYYE